MSRVRQSVLALGTLALVFGLGWYHAHYRADSYQFGRDNPFWAFALLAALHWMAAAVLGVPDEPRDWQPAVFTSALAVAIATGAFTLFGLIRPGLLPRFVLLTAPVVVGLWEIVACGWSHRQRTGSHRGDVVMGVLAQDEASFLRSEASLDTSDPEVPFRLSDVLTLDDLTPAVLDSAARRAHVTVIVLSDDAQRSDLVLEAVATLHEEGVRVRSLEGFCDEWLGKLPLSSLGRMALLTDINEVHGGPYPHLKRGVDVAVGSIGCIICAFLMPVIGTVNLLGNRGPLFFRQTRIGRNGVEFEMYKFRTMYAESALRSADHGSRADKSGSKLNPSIWTEVDDPRITPFGRILRRTHLDELPQFVNILKGELSLVGPRPEQPHYVEELTRKLPFYGLRHIAQPGLTGWAQVKYRYGASEADAFQKLQYDLYYLRHQSVSLDLRVLSRTLRSVVFGRGR